MSESAQSSKKKPRGKSFPKGKSGNPGGRPKLPEDIKQMKVAALAKAIEIMYVKVNDEEYIAELKPSELTSFLETVFDRCGLPKVTKSELGGEGGEPIKYTLTIKT